MSGDKELFEMMGSRGLNANQLPGKTVRYIPEDTAPYVLAIDARIQQIKRHRVAIIAGSIILAFLVGVCV